MTARADDRTSWHKSLTDETIVAAMRRRIGSLDNPGFCLGCGVENDGVDPDGRNYECQACGGRQVFGVAELFQEIA